MEDFYSQFATSFVSGGQSGSPQMKALMATTAANPGQPWSWNQYDSINGMTIEEAMATGKIREIVTPGQSDRGDTGFGPNRSLNQFGSVDMFGANGELGGDTRGRIWGVGGDGRLQDLGLQDTDSWEALRQWGIAAGAGLGATALATGGAGVVGGAAAPGGLELSTAAGMGGAGAAAGGAASGAALTAGGAGGLPGAAVGGLGSLLGGDTGSLLRNLLGGAASLYDSYQGYKDAGEMRDWLVGQTPNFEFYQDKLKQSYEDPGSYWKGADFNAGFDVLHNKLQRNDAAGGRLAADAGRQSELQKYTLDSLNNYRTGLADTVNNQTRARLGANEAFMQNQQNRRDAIAPVTTFLGDLLGG